MRELESPEDVFECLQAYSSAAALGAALELGLPWLLDARPLDDAGVAGLLGIPTGRCRWWLLMLVRLGLLDRVGGRYTLTAGAKRAIVGSHRPETWAFLAREERERLPTVLDLAARLTRPATEPLADEPEGYVQRMAADPERARAFTRMLYDLHGSLADHLAVTLDLSGCRRLLDLGGGSGVMSLALVRRHPGLTSVVVDIANVCAEGHRVVAENGLQDRVSFVVGDLLSGPLPKGFDLVLECDVGVYEEALFSEVRAALEPGGRFAIVDLMAESEDEPPERVLHWGFTAAVSGPGGPEMTWSRLEAMLEACGFRPGPATDLPDGYRLLEAGIA